MWPNLEITFTGSSLIQILNVGTLRECFVVNQLSVAHTVEYGKTQGDFLIPIGKKLPLWLVGLLY